MQTTEEEKAKKWKKGGRLITLKYEAVCADCGAELPAGIQARWYGRGRIYGRGCHSEQPQTEAAGVQGAATAPRTIPNRAANLLKLAGGSPEAHPAGFIRSGRPP